MSFESFLAALGVKLKVVIPGAVGALVSMRFFCALGAKEKLATWLGGVAIAIYCSGPLVAWLGLQETAEPGFALLLGLFGMSIVAAIIKIVTETDWSSIVNRRIGG